MNSVSRTVVFDVEVEHEHCLTQFSTPRLCQEETKGKAMYIVQCPVGGKACWQPHDPTRL